MRYTEYHAGKAVIKDKNKLADAMEKLAKLEDEEESVLENHEKNKVTNLDIIVRMIGDKPYYELKYKLLGENNYNIGYSSYLLDNVVEWKEKYFELVENEIVSKWIPCSEKFPEFKSLGSTGSIDHYETHPVLIQTKRGEMFVAWCRKMVYECEKYDDDYDWYSHGTGGRRMRVMSKVVAWMPLPEPYKEAAV